MKTIGFLIGQGSQAEGQWRIDAFREGLKRHGLIDGRTVRVAVGWGLGTAEGNRRAARDVAALSPSVLIANNSQSLAALRDVAGGAIPIVFSNVSDPVEAGFVESISRPGGMITGFTDAGAGIAAKWVDLLKELSPACRTVALIYAEPMAGFVARFLAPMTAAARQFGLTPEQSPVRTVQDYSDVMRRLQGKNVVAIVADDPLMVMNSTLVANLARQHRIVAMYTNQGFVITHGGLIAYGIGLTDLYIETMDYVNRILNGAKPADLPVRLPSRYRLAINLRTADAIGLTVPATMLARADRLVD